MNLLDELKELGVNVDEGLYRLGGNKAIYKKMLCSSFVKMMNNYSVDPDFDHEMDRRRQYFFLSLFLMYMDGTAV